MGRGTNGSRLLQRGAVVGVFALASWALAGTSAAAPKGASAKADLAVSMVDDADPVRAGSSVTYTVSVQNLSPASATGARLSATFPYELSVQSVTPEQGTCTVDAAVTCSLGSIAGGSSTRVLIRATSWSPGTWAARSSVSADQSDPARSNNVVTEDTSFYDCSYCPTVSITELFDPVRAGEAIAYDITASWFASGSVLQRGTEVVIAIPPDTEYLATSKKCSYADRVVRCDGGRENNVRLVLRAVRPGTVTTTVVTRVRGTTVNSYSATATTTVSGPVAQPAATPAPVHDSAENEQEAAQRQVGETVVATKAKVEALIAWAQYTIENLSICRFHPEC